MSEQRFEPNYEYINADNILQGIVWDQWPTSESEKRPASLMQRMKSGFKAKGVAVNAMPVIMGDVCEFQDRDGRSHEFKLSVYFGDGKVLCDFEYLGFVLNSMPFTAENSGYMTNAIKYFAGKKEGDIIVSCSPGEPLFWISTKSKA